MSAADNNFPKGGGGGGGVVPNDCLRVLVLVCQRINALFQAILDLLGISIRSFLSCLHY